jgi:hypothetical protein
LGKKNAYLPFSQLINVGIFTQCLGNFTLMIFEKFNSVAKKQEQRVVVRQRQQYVASAGGDTLCQRPELGKISNGPFRHGSSGVLTGLVLGCDFGYVSGSGTLLHFSPFPQPASLPFPSCSVNCHIAFQYISFKSVRVAFFCLQWESRSEIIYSMSDAP